MAKTNAMGKLINFVVWLTGVIVSLAVGIALLNQGPLAIPVLGIVNDIAGWIVIILTVVGAILAVANRA